ncbi:hypothetical protein [Aquimarina sp. MMG016]|uniref:hypothetical protein n=1 Tax=Aquimarina sp. MMG016 TaxID=2822690 RepID=UPI001B3A0021|nr:hypothetical protein [Aquimarina sp. MMG016]MBQ4821835.1 hypothetical protein [Aquimarina sp. MMG016]
MKKALKIISTISILIFLVSLISSKFMDPNTLNTTDTRSLFVVIYLFTSLSYYKIENNEKSTIIKDLKARLGEE